MFAFEKRHFFLRKRYLAVGRAHILRYDDSIIFMTAMLLSYQNVL